MAVKSNGSKVSQLLDTFVGDLSQSRPALFLLETFKALGGRLCVDVPLRNYSLSQSVCLCSFAYGALQI